MSDSTQGTQNQSSGGTASQARPMAGRVPYVARLFFPGMSSEFFDHMRNAQREVLLAARALLDARISSLEESGGSAQQRKAQRISIE